MASLKAKVKHAEEVEEQLIEEVKKLTVRQQEELLEKILEAKWNGFLKLMDTEFIWA